MNRPLLLGFSISLLLHCALVGLIVGATHFIPRFEPPLVVDFTFGDWPPGVTDSSVTPVVEKEQLVETEAVEEMYEPAHNTASDLPEPVEETVNIQEVEPGPEPEPVIKPEPPVTAVIEPPAKDQEVAPPQRITARYKKRIAPSVLESPDAPPPPPVRPEKREHPPRQQKQLEHERVVDATPPSRAETAPSHKNGEPRVGDTNSNQRNTTTGDVQNRYVTKHFSYIKNRIQQQTRYPVIARKMGWEGKVLVQFRILTDGSVKNIRVVKTCGFKALDENAVKTIQLCAPFPKPPISAEIVLPVQYNLK